jgi:hypothetical protein
VRNCEARGNRFGIGAERIHSAAKLSVPQTASTAERNQALVEAYHRRLREELPSTAAASTVAPAPAVRTRIIAAPEPQVGAHAEAHAPAATLTIEPPVAEPPAVEPAAAGAFSPKFSPRKPIDVKRDLLQNLPFPSKPRTVPSKVSPLHEEAKPEPEAIQAIAEEPPSVEETLAAVSMASPPEPDNSLRDAFVQGSKEKDAAPSRVKRILLVAVCTVLAVAIILFGPLAKRVLVQSSVTASAAPHVTPQHVTPQHVTPQPARVAAAVTARPVPTTPVPTAPKTPAAPAKAGHSTVTISAHQPAWVLGCSDGKVMFTKTLTAGNEENIEFSKRALVRLGNAGQVEIQLNGKSIGSLGRPGQIRAIELTPDSSHFLHLSDPDGCTQ